MINDRLHVEALKLCREAGRFHTERSGRAELFVLVTWRLPQVTENKNPTAQPWESER
jgi:hypothetical protein